MSSTSAYLELLRRFAEDTGYDGFLAQNSAILDTTEARIRSLVERDLDLDWFRDFWGVDQAQEFLLVPGLVNGRASYGVEYQPPTGPTELYAIVGVTAVDGVGLPTFDEDFALLIAHEFNHSYANALIEARKQRGGFASVDDLLEVKGIGEAGLAKLRPHVAVKGKTTAQLAKVD